MAAKGLISTSFSGGPAAAANKMGGPAGGPLACLSVVFLYLGCVGSACLHARTGRLRLEAPIMGRGFLRVGAPMPGAAGVVTASPACPADEAVVEVVSVLACGLGLIRLWLLYTGRMHVPGDSGCMLLYFGPHASSPSTVAKTREPCGGPARQFSLFLHTHTHQLGRDRLLPAHPNPGRIPTLGSISHSPE